MRICANCQHASGTISNYLTKGGRLNKSTIAYTYCNLRKINVALDDVCTSHVDKDGVRFGDKNKL